MHITGSVDACAGHACDCRTAAPSEVADGVVLIAERRHVRTKVGVLLEQTDGLRLEGPGWSDRLQALVDELSFSERAALLAAPLHGEAEGVALPVMDVLTRARTSWLPELLNGTAIYPHLQPIVALSDGRIYGFESLLRGQVGDRELSGGEIVAAAQAHGAIFTLDLVGRTVALEKGMPKLIGDEVLFVNFTPTAIYDPAVCLRTTWAIARRHGLPMERICFEVVETEQYPDVDFLRRILDEYRGQGAMVALDDLGAGHSSLTYLETLHPDIVKLDRALVTGIDDDPSRQRLVGALIDYAHELDVRVVAEGIETEGELAVVRDLGADLGQGWYLGRPAAEPVRGPRSLVMDAPGGPIRGTTLEVRDRALASATSGVVISDALAPGMPIIYANPAFERLTGYAIADITGRSCTFVQGPDTDPVARAEMGAALREGRESRVTVLNYRRDGNSYWCEVHLAPVRDRHGRVVQYVGVQNDVSERVQAERELREQRDRAHQLATHDALTGLPNRSAFRARAEHLLDHLGETQAAALLFIDVDRFKPVNDLHGHDVGDEVLCAVAGALRRALGPDALLGRHAGDEFIALLTAPDATGVQAQVTATLERATGPMLVHPVAGTITASIGWTLRTPGHPRSLAELIAEADTAMYARKRTAQQGAAA
ncbi:MAG TPA: EAL domain-containing protein [Solirubrobacteraceae bacterium]|nr:EAL domain-containing protein [Solirubrobacteraceae bacterium]